MTAPKPASDPQVDEGAELNDNCKQVTAPKQASDSQVLVPSAQPEAVDASLSYIFNISKMWASLENVPFSHSE